MTFSILTAISPDYADTVRIFLPTWARNSGASRIQIHRLTGDSWSANIIQRAELIRKEVWSAMQRQEHIVWLDADIYILRNIEGGFSPVHPISIARWPNINAGVIFFNTQVAFDWSGFFLGLVAEIRDRCKMVAGERGYSDQKIWFSHLSRSEEKVCKLPVDEWNYTDVWEDWPKRLPKIKDTVRMLHTRGNGDWPEHIHKLMQDTFPEEMGERHG